MEIFKTIAAMQNFLQKAKKTSVKIGFVPTMGALHDGHLALVKKAKSENSIVVVSIFVNPIQFNNKEDLLKYPRTLEKDAALLDAVGCDIIFAPDEKEMYPEPDNTVYEFGKLATVMEAKFRPGHFNGVAVVVKRLFDIVQADNAYFGEKDYQQLQIIKSLVKQKNIPVNIIPCPIVREIDGLAMSSRNMRLTFEERKIAPFIYQTLFQAKEKAKLLTPTDLTNWVLQSINNHKLLTVEYFEIADATTLSPVTDWEDCELAIGCIAVFLGNVRLIDNIVLKQN
ncbi:MAG: pantoate--beta-alanine ligase [Bacteroidales bacterium]